MRKHLLRRENQNTSALTETGYRNRFISHIKSSWKRKWPGSGLLFLLTAVQTTVTCTSGTCETGYALNSDALDINSACVGKMWSRLPIYSSFFCMFFLFVFGSFLFRCTKALRISSNFGNVVPMLVVSVVMGYYNRPGACFCKKTDWVDHLAFKRTLN